MKHRLLVSALTGTGLVLSAWPGFAHHGDAGRYEEDTMVMSGTVVALQLINPHSLIIMDVEDESGQTVRWQVELGNPNSLIREFGWNRSTLKAGDRITVTGRPIKSGAPYVNLTERAQIRMTETGEEIFRTRNYEPSAEQPAGAH